MNRPGNKRQRRKLGSIERDILRELTVGDLLYAHLLSARSTKQFHKLARERAMYRYRRKLAIERLENLNYINTHGKRLSISKEGLGALGGTIGKTHTLLETQPWDHKWRIVAFDIPEKYAALRDKIRKILKEAGFVKLQQSIWIFPHECDELIQLIKDESGLSKYILYGLLERIEDEERLKKLFRL
ncbi:MAG: CRISPR-associated endonuclease Cas2 [bacterium]|nr:CRISPR-associated endonuclease Cas2 [bacterium]